MKISLRHIRVLIQEEMEQLESCFEFWVQHTTEDQPRSLKTLIPELGNCMNQLQAQELGKVLEEIQSENESFKDFTFTVRRCECGLEPVAV